MATTFAEFSVLYNPKTFPKLFEYLSKLGINNTPDAIREITKLLQVAITVMESVQVDKDVEYLKKFVEGTVQSLSEKINSTFSSFELTIDGFMEHKFDPDYNDSYLSKTVIHLRDKLKEFNDSVVSTVKLITTNVEKVSTDKLAGIEAGIKEANKNFDPDSSLSYLGKMKAEVIGVQDKIQQMLDYGRVGSFAFQLKDEMAKYLGKDSPILDNVNLIVTAQQVMINAELIKLREEIARKEGSTEMLGKTAIKGFDFEDTIEKVLNEYVKPFGDIVVRTSSESKSGRTSKKGDFTYEFSDTAIRMVIETKDESVGLKPMLAYLKEAMEYRECEFAILCTKTLDQLPAQVGYFNLYEGNKLFCSADFLPFAVKWAKLYLERIKAGAGTEAVDMGMLKDSVEVIQNALKNFINIKKKLTEINKTVSSTTSEISNLLDDTKDSINTSISTLGL